MSFSNDSRYFCGGRLFTIFSLSQCLAPLIAPCSSALARGYFSVLIAKERITWLCLCWRWGSNPPKKTLHPLISQLPRTFTQFAGLIYNFKPADTRTTGRYLLRAASDPGAGQSDQCWSFPIDGSLFYLHSAAITRGVTFAIFFEKSWRDSHKMLLVAILIENPGNSIVKSGSVLGMGSEQPILVIKLSTFLPTCLSQGKENQNVQLL